MEDDMQLATTDDIFDLLDAYITSAALGAAMELGLFWLLAEGPLEMPQIALSLNIPQSRCKYWLQILVKVGLLEHSTEGYVPSVVTQESILDAYSQDAWAFLAREARIRFPALLDLVVNIRQPVSTWEAQNLTAPDWFKSISENPEYARRFTRMLCEIHLPLAGEIAALLDMRDVRRLMDLGGGSGVVSLALLKRHPALTSLVIDIENVCATGREIAAEAGLEDRITYQVADYMQDDLPSGFDMILFCDAGPYQESLFRKIHGALNPAGRLVIVDQFTQDENVALPSRLSWSFLGSLHNSETTGFSTVTPVKELLAQVGFQDISEKPVPYEEYVRWNSDWVVLEARK